MIEPERAVRMIREIGNDIALADFYQTVLHEFGLDKQVLVDILELGDQGATNQSVKICASDEPHE
jgi:hypothetical protein